MSHDGPGRAAHPVGDESRRPSRIGAWWPVLVPVVVVLVGAWLYRWVDEDAFIDFRIIDNLLAGHGLVYNIGERVEVASDPLWVFSLAFLHEVVPFVALEWLSVSLGLVCTAGGFVAGGRGVQRLARSRQESGVFPLGLLMVSAVAGVWEFATSGLEMSMVFLWLGLSFASLVRVEQHRGRPAAAGVLMGLGTLIRPELVLMSAVLLAALLAVSAPSGRSGRAQGRRVLGVIAAAATAPVVYQLFRMGYFALLTPNTGLAKAAGSAWWSQGLTYLWNFLSPYTLWLPLLLAVPFVAVRASAWWSRGDRTGVVVLVAPILAGLADVLYVVYVGGDYMHARLLLPGFFALCLPVMVSRRQLRTALALPFAAIVVWSVVAVAWLRFVPPRVTSLNPQAVFISNERNNWIEATHRAHPVTAADYRRALSGQAGAALAALARATPSGRQHLVLVTDPFAPFRTWRTEPATSPLPFAVTVNVPAIGVLGYVAGPRVYIYDEFSLANPVGSHTPADRQARPGHEKYIGPVWMLGRFGSSGLPPVPGGPSRASVAAAGAALRCDPLNAYLRAITSPLTLGRAFDNLGDSFGFTTMSFSANPRVAVLQLCGAGHAPDPAVG
ncbi:MAG: hypothetical protein ACRDYE_08655 [Acidimicrobiales bacterium]